MAALPSMSQTATFICNAAPIVPYFHFFGNRLLRKIVGWRNLGQFKVVRYIILAIANADAAEEKWFAQKNDPA
jgi:hypothetical protein